MNREEWAYFAGFFDGEGCISVMYSSKRIMNPAISLRVTQVDRTPLDWIQKRLGGSVKPNYRSDFEEPIHIWTCSRRLLVMDILRQVYPFLIVKKAQANLAYQLLQLYGGDSRIEGLIDKLHGLKRKRVKLHTL